MTNITIRKGTEADMPQVHQLVYELALFEKAPEEVITNAEIFARDGFGDRPLFECFVAENEEGKIVGIALFYFGYSTWKGKKLYLDDLVITESYRRKGIGNMLFDRLVKYGVEHQVSQMRWHVLDWNTPAIKMYEGLEAEMDEEWITCKLSREQLAKWGE